MAVHKQILESNPVASRINSIAKRLDCLKYADAELRGIIQSTHLSWDMKLAAGTLLEQRQAQKKSMEKQPLQ